MKNFCIAKDITKKSKNTTHRMGEGDLPGGSNGKESACNAWDLGLIPGLGRSPGGGHGNPLHYSCLENSMDRGAWRATVHGVSKSRTQLSDWAWHRMRENTCRSYIRDFISWIYLKKKHNNNKNINNLLFKNGQKCSSMACKKLGNHYSVLRTSKKLKKLKNQQFLDL